MLDRLAAAPAEEHEQIITDACADIIGTVLRMRPAQLSRGGGAEPPRAGLDDRRRAAHPARAGVRRRAQGRLPAARRIRRSTSREAIHLELAARATAEQTPADLAELLGELDPETAQALLDDVEQLAGKGKRHGRHRGTGGAAFPAPAGGTRQTAHQPGSTVAASRRRPARRGRARPPEPEIPSRSRSPRNASGSSSSSTRARRSTTCPGWRTCRCASSPTCSPSASTSSSRGTRSCGPGSRCATAGRSASVAGQASVAVTVLPEGPARSGNGISAPRPPVRSTCRWPRCCA